MTWRLRVESPDAPPFEHALTGTEVTIGRAPQAGLTIPDARASRQHARVFSRDGTWWAEDLGARNGTLLNGVPLVEPTKLASGDCLRLGGSTIAILDVDAEAAEEAAGRLSRVVGPPVAAGAEGVTEDRQAARLRTINEVHRALAAPISLDALLELILDRCFDVLSPEEGVILLRGPDGEWRPAAVKRAPHAKGELMVSRRLSAQVADRGQPALVLDAPMDERFAGSHSIVASGVRSVVAAPLVDAAGSIGMVALASSVGVRKFSSEDLDMLVSIASAAALRVRNVGLAEEAAARKVLEREMALAHDMQMAMLPRQFPTHPAVDLAAHLTPARSVGGDLYDFVEDGSRLWFIVADVAGKGVSAALMMAVVKTLFRAMVPGETELPRLLRRMNTELCRDNDQMVFVTAVVGWLDLATGAVVAGDAGHNPAWLVRDAGTLTPVAIPKSIALGVLPEAVFGHATFLLEPTQCLVLYTDGVTDARNLSGEMFGSERLEAVLGQAGGRSASDVVRHVREGVGEFENGAPPEDDVTILAVRWRG